jgi:GntR family transcriptional regulator/MocR family aminotransferase
LAWSQQTGGLIVEDDYDSEFRYDREPVRALQGLAPSHVIHIGTVSKTLAPALRLGWIVTPEELVDELEHVKRLADDFSPVLDQLTLAELLSSGGYSRHLRRARMVYRARRDALVEALERELPDLAVEGIAAGVHLVLRLPSHVDDTAVARAASTTGIAVPALSTFRLSPSPSGGLVVGYGRLHEAAVASAAAALAASVTAHL